MKFMTKPKILEEFKSKLYVVNGKASDRIAIAILISEYLVYVINPKYTGGAIRKTLKKICHNTIIGRIKRPKSQVLRILKLLKA